MKDAITGNSCHTCRCYHRPNPKMSGVCVAHPPQVVLVGMRAPSSIVGPKAQQQMLPVTQSFYPPVSPEHGCVVDWRAANALDHEAREPGGGKTVAQGSGPTEGGEDAGEK